MPVIARAMAIASLIMAGLILPFPALAQSNIEGEWMWLPHEERLDPAIGEFDGLPINDAARYRAVHWNASLWTVPEHQCIPHPADYGPTFSPVRIWREVNPLTQETVAYHTMMAWNNPVRTIWMDGRAHPPENALHTWEGFSTGRWDGDMLVVRTTHMKPGYLRRNGTPRSERAVLTEYFIRSDDVLTWVSIVEDPVYLTEPYIKSRNFRLDPGYQSSLYTCSIDVEIDRPAGEIPHYIDGNPQLFEEADARGIPHAASMGGAETMYPEYQAVIRADAAQARTAGGD